MFNLSWKLDHILRGKAGLSLLDTYTVERLPHVRDLIRALGSSYSTFLECLQKRFLRIARNASKAVSGDAIDLDGIYGRLFSEAGIESVLVQWDFYIFGGSSSVQEFDSVVDDLQRQLLNDQQNQSDKLPKAVQPTVLGHNQCGAKPGSKCASQIVKERST